jgi:nucleoid DNA-binding protein
MSHKPKKNLGRAYLVAKLQERGCSRRQSVEILNLVFREMSKALKGGKKVEFPSS